MKKTTLFALLATVALMLATSLNAQDMTRRFSVSLNGSLTQMVRDDITKGYIGLTADYKAPLFRTDNGELSLLAGMDLRYSLPHQTEYAHTAAGLTGGLALRSGRLEADGYIVAGLLTRDNRQYLFYSPGARLQYRVLDRLSLYADARWQLEKRCLTFHNAVDIPARFNAGIGVAFHF